MPHASQKRQTPQPSVTNRELAQREWIIEVRLTVEDMSAWFNLDCDCSSMEELKEIREKVQSWLPEYWLPAIPLGGGKLGFSDGMGWGRIWRRNEPYRWPKSMAECLRLLRRHLREHPADAERLRLRSVKDGSLAPA